MLSNWTPATQSSDFVNHSYDYRPNWTLLSPVTITYYCYYYYHLFCELAELLHVKTPHFKLEAWNGSLMEQRVILSYMILQ